MKDKSDEPQSHPSDLSSARASLLISEGALDGAASIYQAIVSDDPTNLSALIGLGRIARIRGDAARALTHFRTAASAYPGNLRLQAEIAILLRETGNNSEAEEALQSCLSDPACPRELRPKLLVPLGCLLAARGEKAKALICYSEAVSIDPTFRWAQLELARALRDDKKFEQAEAAYRVVLELVRSDLDALLGLAYVARQMGDRSLAFERFRAAAAAHPEAASPRAEIAVELSILGRTGEAAEMYSSLLNEYPQHPWAWLGLGQARRRLGDRKGAFEAFRRALEVDPKSISARLECAIEARDAGALDEAKAIAQSVLRDEPSCAGAYVSLAATLRRLGDHQRALECMQKAAELEPSELQHLIHISELHKKLGDPDAAKGVLDAALSRDPGNSVVLAKLGEISLLALDPDSALDYFQRALRLNNSMTEVFIGIAQARADQGRISDALSFLDDAERQCGPRPEFFVRRAELMRRIGRLDCARVILGRAREKIPNVFWLRGKQVELDLVVGEIAVASKRLNEMTPSSQQERALWHLYRAMLAEAEWRLTDAIEDYRRAVALNPEEAWWHHELARVSLLCLDIGTAEKHLHEFNKLETAGAKLQGRSNNLSQSHLGQILDEYRLQMDVIDKIRDLGTESEIIRAASLEKIARENRDSTVAAIAFLNSARQRGLFRSSKGTACNSVIPRKIVQYWDTTDPPADLADFMASWRSTNSDFRYHLFDDIQAQQFISGRYPRYIVRAYHKATEAAQKADLFRLAWLFSEGGIYADVDDRCIAPIQNLLPEDATAVFFQEEFGTIGNNFIAIVPGHPVIKTALELGAEALNRGDRDLIWLSTGPGLLTRALVRAWTEFPQRQSLKGIVILDRGILRRAVGPHCAAAYKKTAQHWSRSAFSIRSTTKISQPLTKNNEPADSI